jgi:hypothetical protein
MDYFDESVYDINTNSYHHKPTKTKITYPKPIIYYPKIKIPKENTEKIPATEQEMDIELQKYYTQIDIEKTRLQNHQKDLQTIAESQQRLDNLYIIQKKRDKLNNKQRHSQPNKQIQKTQKIRKRNRIKKNITITLQTQDETQDNIQHKTPNDTQDKIQNKMYQKIDDEVEDKTENKTNYQIKLKDKNDISYLLNSDHLIRQKIKILEASYKKKRKQLKIERGKINSSILGPKSIKQDILKNIYGKNYKKPQRLGKKERAEKKEYELTNTFKQIQIDKQARILKIRLLKEQKEDRLLLKDYFDILCLKLSLDVKVIDHIQKHDIREFFKNTVYYLYTEKYNIDYVIFPNINWTLINNLYNHFFAF